MHVFRGNDNNLYLCKTLRSGEVWIFSLHPDNKWVSQGRISPFIKPLVNNNMTLEEQEPYLQLDPNYNRTKL